MKLFGGKFNLLFLGIFLAPLTSAYYFPGIRFQTEQALQFLTDFFEPVLQALLGGYEWGPSLLFERLLLFIILVAVIYLTLGNVPVFGDQKRIRWLIAFLVPLIGVRFIDYAWIITIIIQYQVLAIALTALLPFMLYFFFLYNSAGDHPGVRKIGWVLFIVVYFGLWSTTSSEANSFIYFWTMAISLIFLLFDGTIYGYYERQKMKAAGSANKWTHVMNIKRDIDEIQDSIRRQHIPQKTGEKLLKKKQQQLDWVMKHM